MASIVSTKLDNRFTGYKHFQYRANLTSSQPVPEMFSSTQGGYADLINIIDHVKLRDWCWDTWGPSCDLKDYIRIAELRVFLAVNERTRQSEDYELNEHWCFSNESIVNTRIGRERRIYLAGDAELAWLGLKWQ